MARRSARAGKKRTQNIVWGSVALLVVAAVTSIVAYLIVTRVPPADVATLCPASGPLGHYIVLIDTTDPLTFTQGEAFAGIFNEIVERRVPEGYLLSVFALGENFKENAKPVIECNPGSGAGKSQMTANIEKLKRQYRERFRDPMLKKIAALPASQAAKHSPIFEMMQLVAINGFRKQSVSGDRVLIVMSDMLQNTPQFTMYRGRFDFGQFQQSDYGRKMQLDLGGVDVELLYLMNYPQLQTRSQLAFWEEYFAKAGARLVSVRPLEG